MAGQGVGRIVKSNQEQDCQFVSQSHDHPRPERTEGNSEYPN